MNIKLNKAASTALALVVIATLASQEARAQGAGTVHGVVTDPSAAVIPGATVTVTGGGQARTEKTDGQGRYSVTLPAGQYSIQVQAAGFVTGTRSDVPVAANQSSALDVALEVAARAQQVDVNEAGAGTVSTDPSNNASALVMTQSDIEGLPDDPDDLQAVLTSMAGPAAGPNGAQFFVDGFSGGVLPPKASIREIRINSNPFASEYDRPGFGRVEILTRPGTDTLHGQIGFNYGNRIFDTRNAYLTGPLPDYNSRMISAELSGSFLRRFSWNLDTDPQRVFNDSSLVNAQALDSNFNQISVNHAYPTPSNNWQVEPRLDYAINTNNTLVTRYQHQTSSTVSGIGGFNLPTQEIDGTNKTNTLQVTETMVIGTKAVDETRFQLQDTRSNTSGLGISGPTINVQSSFTSGGSPLLANFNRNRSYEVQNVLTTTHGKHASKFGFRVRTADLSTQSTSNFNGTWTFSTPNSIFGVPRCLTGITNPTSLDVYEQTERLLAAGTPMASILAQGCGPSSFTLNGGVPQASVSQTDLGVFAGDDWRLRPNLTLSAGVRVETQTNISDHFDFAPRAAVSWAPAGKLKKTVFRVGWGRFFERFPANNVLQTMRFDGVQQQNYNISSTSGGTSADLALAAYPGIPSTAALSIQNQPIYKIDSNLSTAYLMQTSLSIERALPHRTSLAVSVNDSRGVHDARRRNINAFLPGTYNPITATGVVPYAGQGDIYLYENTGIYKQLQVITSVNTRLNSHVSLNGYYAWGEYHTNTNGFPMNQYDTSIDWGRAGGDVRNRGFISGGVGLPLKLIASPIVNIGSAPPFNITTGIDNNGDRIVNDRPSFATAADNPNNVVVTKWGTFNKSPLPGETLIPINYGTGYGVIGVNLRLSRSWGWGEKGGPAQAGGPQGGGQQSPGGGFGGLNPRGGGGGGFGSLGGSGKKYTVTFTVDATNVINHVNHGPPVGSLNSPFFGESLSSAGSGFGGGGGGGGGGGSATGNRRIQFRLRFSF